MGAPFFVISIETYEAKEYLYSQKQVPLSWNKYSRI